MVDNGQIKPIVGRFSFIFPRVTINTGLEKNVSDLVIKRF